MRGDGPGDGGRFEVVHLAALRVPERQHEFRGFAGVADETGRVEVRSGAAGRFGVGSQANDRRTLRERHDVLVAQDVFELRQV
jgi:hypothetical protein